MKPPAPCHGPSLYYIPFSVRSFASGPKASQAQAKSYIRCRPIQIVWGPGWLSGAST